eukprot:gene10003-10869_t
MILTTHINKTLKLRFIARNYKLNPLLTPQVTALPLNSITLNPSNRYFSSTGNGEKPVEKVQKLSLFDRWFGKEASVASPTFKNRWAMVVPAVLTHICIGSPYGWSLVADIITREYGFVAPAAADWALMQTSMALSIVFAFHGLSATALGKWQLKVGPRKSMAYAALAFGGALGFGSLGVYLHNLPLIYLGYGALGGIGIGLGYTPPLFADVNGQLVEVVQAGAAELSKIPYTLSEGLYVVGSGSTGAMEALGAIGAVYFAAMLASAITIKDPHPSYAPAVPVVTTTSSAPPVEVVKYEDVSVEDAVRSPQFPLLGLSFFCLAAGGMGIFSVAKPMMSEVFSSVLPTVVTSAFAAQFVLMLSAGNLGGRLGWAAISDAIGRRKTFMIFTFGSIPIYLSLPYIVESVVTSGSTLPLYLFCGGTMAAISGMGGAFALLPAYEADLFGTKNIAAIHGRMLLASSSAGIAGPYMLLKLRSIAENNAIQDLLQKVGAVKFESAFGVPIEQANELIATKTLTISKLLALAPPGTIDPTPHLYDMTMYTLGSMMVVGALSHYMVKPLKRKPVVIDVKENLIKEVEKK